MALGAAPDKGLPHATVVFVGHHQAGKSTTAGHIVVKLGGIDKRNQERVERDTTNRPMSRYAWVLDRHRLERDRAMSIDLKLCHVTVPPKPLVAVAVEDAAAAAAAVATAGGAGAAGAGAGAGGLSLTVLDTPGHPDYLRNTIAAITQADVAVLVVDSRPAVLDSASSAAQTRDLANLAFNLANPRALVVAVNHLDVAYESDLAEQRFTDAVAAVTKLLKGKKEVLTFVPISGFQGDNLTEPSPAKLPWWKGPTLMGAVAAAAAATAAAAAATAAAVAAAAGPSAVALPLRMPVIGVYKVGGIGTVPAGRVAGGSLRRGTATTFVPDPRPTGPGQQQGQAGQQQGHQAQGQSHQQGQGQQGQGQSQQQGQAGAAAAAGTSAAAAAVAGGMAAAGGGRSSALCVRSVESFHDSRLSAVAGDFVGVAVKGLPAAALRRGFVLSDAADRPALVAASFTARVQVLRDPTTKRDREPALGMQVRRFVPLVHVHTAQAPCRLMRVRRFNNKGDVVLEEDAQYLREGDIAEVELAPLRPLVVEPFKQFPTMGRFAIRASLRTQMRGAWVVTPVIVAVGRVESVKYVRQEDFRAPSAAEPSGPPKGQQKAGGKKGGGGEAGGAVKEAEHERAGVEQKAAAAAVGGSGVVTETITIDMAGGEEGGAPEQAAASEAQQQQQQPDRAAVSEAQQQQQVQQQDLESYTDIMKGENMVSNKEVQAKYHSAEDMEGDFM